jgi:ribosomal protein L9
MAKKKVKKEKKIPVLLLDDILNVGQKGTVVLVKHGFYRYLKSHKKALLATKEKLEKELKPLLLQEKIKSRKQEVDKLKQEIENLKLEFFVTKFSKITKDKILKSLKEAGFKLSKSQINLEKKIEKPGKYKIKLNLGYNTEAVLNIDVKQKD